MWSAVSGENVVAHPTPRVWYPENIYEERGAKGREGPQCRYLFTQYRSRLSAGLAAITGYSERVPGTWEG